MKAAYLHNSLVERLNAEKFLAYASDERLPMAMRKLASSLFAFAVKNSIAWRNAA